MVDNITQLEKNAGQNAARNIGRTLRKTLKNHFNKDTGKLFKTTARAKMKYDALDSIVVTSPKYSFIHHYGYSKKYKSGKTLESEGTEHFSEALNRTNTLENLATTIANLRVEKVMALIRL